MELGLSLGDPSGPFGFSLPKDQELNNTPTPTTTSSNFCMALGINPSNGRQVQERDNKPSDGDESEEAVKNTTGLINGDRRASVDPPFLQLDLLPLAPVPRSTASHQHQGLSWPSDNGSSSGGSSGQMGLEAGRGFDVNRLPPATATATGEAEDGAAAVSSPNSVASSFQMGFCIYRDAVGGNKRDQLEAAGNDGGEMMMERAFSRGSDEDDNALTRKKLRLSKEQSAYLEESFKEHNTLNPKQKLALAKQLNLRPRQVEVWFQNRRARTKLKQTEVDCEYLKRCCETLTEENRRLHKELQELRALKSPNPFYMQLPATTLTMCPSCERVATTTTTTSAAAAASSSNPNSADPSSKATPSTLSRPKFYPFSQPQPHQSPGSS